MFKKKYSLETQHCCRAMKYAVEDPFCALEYLARLREYRMRGYASSGGIVVLRCFHCGTNLPESLRHLWYKILKKEYGLEAPILDFRKVPKEFRSDVWWKKLGYKDVEDSRCNVSVKRVCG